MRGARLNYQEVHGKIVEYRLRHPGTSTADMSEALGIKEKSIYNVLRRMRAKDSEAAPAKAKSRKTYTKVVVPSPVTVSAPHAAQSPVTVLVLKGELAAVERMLRSVTL